MKQTLFASVVGVGLALSGCNISATKQETHSFAQANEVTRQVVDSLLSEHEPNTSFALLEYNKTAIQGAFGEQVVQPFMPQLEAERRGWLLVEWSLDKSDPNKNVLALAGTLHRESHTPNSEAIRVHGVTLAPITIELAPKISRVSQVTVEGECFGLYVSDGVNQDTLEAVVYFEVADGKTPELKDCGAGLLK